MSFDKLSFFSAHGGGGEDVTVGDQTFTVGGGVGEDHAHTSSSLDHAAFGYAGVVAAVTEDDLALHERRVKGAGETQAGAVRVRRVSFQSCKFLPKF